MLQAKQNVEKFVARQLDRVIDKIETKGEAFLDYLGRQSVNNSRDGNRPGAWIDRTGNLRASIEHRLFEGSAGPYAKIFAVMEYAVHVHFRDGYRVLIKPTKAEAKKAMREFKL